MAVRMRDCPATLSFKFLEAQARSDEQVIRDYPGHQNETAPQEALNQKNIFERVGSYSYRGELVLVEKAQSICKYANYKQEAAKFYTIGGRAVLRFKLRAGASNLGIYVTAKNDYSAKHGLSVDPEHPIAGVDYQLEDSNGEFSNTLRIGSLKKITLGL